MSIGKASPTRWSAGVVGAIAVACCLAGPALAGLLGGVVLWGVGPPVALAMTLAAGFGCYALITARRRRRRNAS